MKIAASALLLLTGCAAATAASQSPDSFQGLGFLPGSNASMAYAISADGSTVVGQGGQAWRWSATTGMVGLGFLVPSLHYSATIAVNSNGSVIVGIGEPHGGGYQAFRWTATTGMVAPFR